MSPARVLYVSPFAVDPGSGGGRHAWHNLRGILGLDVEVSIVAPPGRWPTPPGARLRPLQVRAFTRRDRVRALLAREATSLYGLWRDVPEAADTRWDCVFVESTRCGFVLRALAGKAPLVCCVHNVEADYLAANRRGLARASALLVRRSEADTLRHASTLLALHPADEARLRARYGDLRPDVVMHPVCSPAVTAPRPWGARGKTALYLASLHLPGNADAAVALAERLWPRVRAPGYTLVVAGRRPSPALVARLSRAPRVRVVPDPPDVAPWLADARAVIVPDAQTVGMKVRVAEALGAGVPVVGTTAGLAGYEAAFGRGVVAVAGPEVLPEALSRLLAGDGEAATAARTSWEAWYAPERHEARVAAVVAGYLRR